jgi:hypothetical protein
VAFSQVSPFRIFGERSSDPGRLTQVDSREILNLVSATDQLMNSGYWGFMVEMFPMSATNQPLE